ncbi:MAG: hypothetical protein Q7T49_03075 [bacterium]|nr:hypothetical protein [bacterium]
MRCYSLSYYRVKGVVLEEGISTNIRKNVVVGDKYFLLDRHHTPKVKGGRIHWGRFKKIVPNDIEKVPFWVLAHPVGGENNSREVTVLTNFAVPADFNVQFSVQNDYVVVLEEGEIIEVEGKVFVNYGGDLVPAEQVELPAPTVKRPAAEAA